MTDGRTFYTNGCNSAVSGNRVMVLAFCIFIGPQSIYKVLFFILSILSEICSGQAFYCKFEKGKKLRKYWRQGYDSCILQFSLWPSISVSSFIILPLILLEICSGQKCDNLMDGWADGWTDGRTDGRSDGQSGDYMLILRGA